MYTHQDRHPTPDNTPMRPMKIPIDPSTQRIQDKSSIPAIHTIRLKQDSIKHSMTLFRNNQSAIRHTKGRTHHAQPKLKPADTDYHSNHFPVENCSINFPIRYLVAGTHYNSLEYDPPQHSGPTLLLETHTPTSTYRRANACYLRSVGIDKQRCDRQAHDSSLLNHIHYLGQFYTSYILKLLLNTLRIIPFNKEGIMNGMDKESKAENDNHDEEEDKEIDDKDEVLDMEF